MEPEELVEVERLPCPACRRVTDAPPREDPIEVVHCVGCGKLLRRRPRRSPEQHAQALALRWAAARLDEDDLVVIVRGRRKLRGDDTESYVRGISAAAEKLREWARTIHKRAQLREADASHGVGRDA